MRRNREPKMQEVALTPDGSRLRALLINPTTHKLKFRRLMVLVCVRAPAGTNRLLLISIFRQGQDSHCWIDNDILPRFGRWNGNSGIVNVQWSAEDFVVA